MQADTENSAAVSDPPLPELEGDDSFVEDVDDFIAVLLQANGGVVPESERENYSYTAWMSRLNKSWTN